MMKNRRLRNRRAFTLIELLVVLVILALLAGIVLPKFLERGEQAKVGAAQTQIGSFKNALQLYMVDNGDAPSSQQGLDALIHEPSTTPKPRNWKKPYLDTPTIQPDPWGNEYHYESPGPNGEDFYIVSYGKDGKPGGGDDIDSSNTQSK